MPRQVIQLLPRPCQIPNDRPDIEIARETHIAANTADLTEADGMTSESKFVG